MNKTQAGRLLTLAYFLKTQVKPKHFDMGSYASSPAPTKCDLHEPVCGTSGCAIGWATVVWPTRFALRQQRFMDGEYSCVVDLVFDGFTSAFSSLLVLRFFGLTEEESFLLFSGSHTRTPKQAAKVIEDLVYSKGYEYA